MKPFKMMVWIIAELMIFTGRGDQSDGHGKKRIKGNSGEAAP
jgi:hypothetical protein